MTESKECPKCSGNMAQGYLKEIGNYGNSRTQFAPVDEAPLPVKGAPTQRCGIVLYRCGNCGFLEMYAPET
jgi:predicted nucleic-acid-binding Zn-ribbon protein